MTLKCKPNTIRSLPPNGLDGLILRFYGYWDDRYEVEGELHFYEVLYYLVDDTMELVELIDENKPDGTMTRKIIVKRKRLPTVRRIYIFFGRKITNIVQIRGFKVFYT